ncbi:MAG: DUF2894 domain-containing protein, partial [Burkholderiaceae bacterium]
GPLRPGEAGLMSGSGVLEPLPSRPSGAPSLLARLEALRQAGERLDPVRLHYLELLSQRIATAPEAVQRVLEGKLDAALMGLEQRLAKTQPASSNDEAPRPAAPLAALNHYLRGLKPPGDSDARPDLASVRRFRETWQRITAEDQVAEAVERGPANAGPLNSHRLALRTLGLLRDLSPDYLRRFLSHVETLQWLEQASQTIAPVKPKAARRSRVKK